MTSGVHVLRPAPGARSPMTVDVPPGSAFVMVMRDDTSYCVATLGRRLAAERGAAARCALSAAVTMSYRSFQQDVRDALRATVAHPHGITFHLFDPVWLERAVRWRAGSAPVVSLDPLIRRDVIPLDLSRGFLLGGIDQVDLVPRPGTRSVSAQLGALRRRVGGTCILIEDDICTGDTIAQVVDLMREAGVHVRRVIPGVRLTSSRDASVMLDPVLEYRVPAGAQVHKFVGLADPRNFLLGISGLVVRLPAMGWGRAPYWLPFVRTSARIGTDADYDRPFALQMIEANRQFFRRIERLAGQVRVGHLHPSVRLTLAAAGIGSDVTPVLGILEMLTTELDRFTERLRRLR